MTVADFRRAQSEHVRVFEEELIRTLLAAAAEPLLRAAQRLRYRAYEAGLTETGDHFKHACIDLERAIGKAE